MWKELKVLALPRAGVKPGAAKQLAVFVIHPAAEQSDVPAEARTAAFASPQVGEQSDVPAALRMAA